MEDEESVFLPDQLEGYDPSYILKSLSRVVFNHKAFLE